MIRWFLRQTAIERARFRTFPRWQQRTLQVIWGGMAVMVGLQVLILLFAVAWRLWMALAVLV